MKYKQFIIFIIILCNVVYIYSLVSDNDKLRNSIYDKNKEIVKAKQNDSLSTVKIKEKLKIIDAKENEIELLQTKLKIKADTIRVYSRPDTILVTIDSNKVSTYTVTDSLKINSSDYVTAIVSIEVDSNRVSNNSNFNWIYKPKENTLISGVTFNVETKLLRSYTLFNGERYDSNVNMYSKMYDAIYDDFISEKPKIEQWRWYHRINLYGGIGIDYKKEVNFSIGIGYGLSVREIIDNF